VFYHVQPVVRDLLTVMRLNHYFTIANDKPEALASLRTAASA
jgi:hypothetical protein